MPEIEIHNGEILIDGVPQPQPVSGLALAKPSRDGGKPEDIEPEEIARAMAGEISRGIGAGLTPMEIVNGLLTLKSPLGHKLVWTRFDVYQTFAIWSKKMEGRAKL